jgi:hypothetical protein
MLFNELQFEKLMQLLDQWLPWWIYRMSACCR